MFVFKPAGFGRLSRAAFRRFCSSSQTLTDRHGRFHDYLRISLTEKCNLRCQYCMPQEGVTLSPQSALLTSDEIIRVASVFVSQGVTKIRLTGGEPTVRPDFVAILERLNRLKRQNGLQQVALTTNGVTLARRLSTYKQNGLDAVNISLDTLVPNKFETLTRRPGKTLSNVLKGISQAVALGYDPVKVNVVLMRGVNDDEILAFCEMTRDQPVDIRFIEFMPFDGNKWKDNKMMSYLETLSRIRDAFPDTTRVPNPVNDTAKTYRLSASHAGTVGFVSSMTAQFCGGCNRLRLTADGHLKVCLFGNTELDLKPFLRGGDATEDRLVEAIGCAVDRKHKQHAESPNHAPHLGHSMMMNQAILFRSSSVQSSLFNSRRAFCSDGGGNKKSPVWSSLEDPSTLISNLRRRSNSIHQELANVVRENRTGTGSARDQRAPAPSRLSHIEPSTSDISMVNVAGKTPTIRKATATAVISMSRAVYDQLDSLKKGDLFVTAKIAGIQAAKATSSLIPLCHPIRTAHVDISIEKDPTSCCLRVVSTVVAVDSTGCEMEALTGASVACLTLYDMCKSIDNHKLCIKKIQLKHKSGGKSSLPVKSL